MKGKRNHLTPLSKELDIKEVEKVVSHAPKEVTKEFRKMLSDLDRGLPRATSGEVLSSRVKW